MAELAPEEKAAISHRARAARLLVVRLMEAEEESRLRGPIGDLSHRSRRGRRR